MDCDSPLPATWRTALVALRRNKMRSTLSALGVIIAVAAVIAMTESVRDRRRSCSRRSPAWAQHADDFAGGDYHQRREHGVGSMTTLTPADADEILAVPGRGGRGRNVHTDPRSFTAVTTAAQPNQRYDAGLCTHSRLGGHGRGSDVHRLRRAELQHGVRDRRHGQEGRSPTNHRSARKFA